MKILLFSVLLCLASAAAAQPVKCVDAKGKIRYLDASMALTEKCSPVPDATNIVNPQVPSAAFERQRTQLGSGAEDARAQAEGQLAAAEGKLAEARKNLAEQEAIRGGDERNYARVLERLKPYQDAVEQAQREVDGLRGQQR